MNNRPRGKDLEPEFLKCIIKEVKFQQNNVRHAKKQEHTPHSQGEKAANRSWAQEGPHVGRSR